MTAPSLPTGFDVAKHVAATRADCALTVGFDRRQGYIPRFLVQLHYQVATAPVVWHSIARMDHNETAATGHDVYREGLHVDADRRVGPEVHLALRHGPLPANRGAVIRGCVDYLDAEADYFVDVFEGRHSPGPPRWAPDGGEREPTFIRSPPVDGGMSRNADADALSREELTELLADATGTDAEALDREARDMEIAPPAEADVVDETE
ncbi:hypothetical protein ACFQL0_22095 [Haloplanus litoreus]|uniref:DUF7718 family protein n=1 Tax=Haloplanus litoreus TaxID=767515 RepID=UPI00360A8DA3